MSPMNRSMLSRDAGLRCASEPKQMHAVWRAISAAWSVKGMWSHATFSVMTYCGMPAASRVTFTVPVGRSSSGRRNFMPRLCSVSRSSRPLSSSPTALTAMASYPNCDMWNAKLAGAPPIFLPSGNTSHNASPIPTMCDFFMVGFGLGSGGRFPPLSQR